MKRRADMKLFLVTRRACRPAHPDVTLAVSALAAPCRRADPLRRTSPSRRTVTFLAGGAAGLAMHEAGHRRSPAPSFGAHPRVAPARRRARAVLRRSRTTTSRGGREFVISSVRVLDAARRVSEWILTARPESVATSIAPFLKGVLAFNVGTSVVYSVAAFARSGPPERDTRGMAVSLGHDGDARAGRSARSCSRLRCSTATGICKPESTWAKWTSRGVQGRRGAADGRGGECRSGPDLAVRSAAG